MPVLLLLLLRHVCDLARVVATRGTYRDCTVGRLAGRQVDWQLADWLASRLLLLLLLVLVRLPSLIQVRY